MKINQNVIEIDTTLYLVSKKDSKMSPISICFSTLVNFEKKLEKTQMEEIILVEVPKTVYPEIRSTLIFLFEKSGFKEVNLQKEIDFKKEKQKLIKRHIYVHNYEKKFIVNPIHGLVKKETFKKNIFAHTKYHLNQFGVL